MLPQEAAGEADLRDYLQILRRRKTIIALCVFVVLAVALTLSYLQTPRYAASAKLLLKSRSAESLFNTNSRPEVLSARSVETEIEVIKTEPVRDLVRKKVGAAPPVKVSAVGETDR